MDKSRSIERAIMTVNYFIIIIITSITTITSVGRLQIS